MSSSILRFMYLWILGVFRGKTSPIQGFRVRRCLSTANSGEVEAHHACPPGKVGQVALVIAMHRGRWDGTTWTACLRRRRRQLKPHGVLFQGDLVQAHVGS